MVPENFVPKQQTAGGLLSLKAVRRACHVDDCGITLLNGGQTDGQNWPGRQCGILKSIRHVMIQSHFADPTEELPTSGNGLPP